VPAAPQAPRTDPLPTSPLLHIQRDDRESDRRWDGNRQKLTHSEHFGLIAPIAVHWSNQEGLPLVPGSAERMAEIQERAVGLLPAAVIAIDQFWKGRRKGALPVTRPAVSGSTAKVGRNDPCPCGSGKKYKRCCAA
jgi:hypothetical protein